MEELRHWLIISLFAVFLIIFLDAIRRMRIRKRDGYVIGRELHQQRSAGGGRKPRRYSSVTEPKNPIFATDELPNGGARVVNLKPTTPAPNRQHFDDPKAHFSPQKSVENTRDLHANNKQQTARERQRLKKSAYKSTPMMERAADTRIVDQDVSSSNMADAQSKTRSTLKPKRFAKNARKRDMELDQAAESVAMDKNEPFISDKNLDNTHGDLGLGSERMTLSDELADTLDQDVELSAAKAKSYRSKNSMVDKKVKASAAGRSRAARKSDNTQRTETSSSPMSDMIALSAVNREGFPAQALIKLAEACGMEYGDMNIFHRNELDDGSGAVQFSMASCVEPGTFKLDALAGQTLPGVTFFMCLQGPSDPMTAVEYMVETARCLVKNLGGDILDEGRSVITEQTLEHYRQRVRDFELQNLRQQGLR